jgi:hypothetical protein
MLKLALVIVGLLVAAAIAWTLASATTTTASGTRKPRCPPSTDRWPVGCVNAIALQIAPFRGPIEFAHPTGERGDHLGVRHRATS